MDVKLITGYQLQRLLEDKGLLEDYKRALRLLHGSTFEDAIAERNTRDIIDCSLSWIDANTKLNKDIDWSSFNRYVDAVIIEEIPRKIITENKIIIGLKLNPLNFMKHEPFVRMLIKIEKTSYLYNPRRVYYDLSFPEHKNKLRNIINMIGIDGFIRYCIGSGSYKQEVKSFIKRWMRRE